MARPTDLASDRIGYRLVLSTVCSSMPEKLAALLCRPLEPQTVVRPLADGDRSIYDTIGMTAWS